VLEGKLSAALHGRTLDSRPDQAVLGWRGEKINNPAARR
jgi:hypothetical protein